MEKEQQLEFWLRGPLPGIVPVLQPVVHAIFAVPNGSPGGFTTLPGSYVMA